MLSLKTLAVTSALALQAAATTIRIDVGKNGLVFSPNSTNAAIGDVLEFHFYARNHSVVQGRYDQPCAPFPNNPFYSGFIPATESAENATVFQVTVASTAPAVYYCSQTQHCAKGMYAVINPSGQNTLQQYGSRVTSNVTAIDPPSNIRVPNGGVYSVQSNLQTSTSSSATSAPTGPAATPTGGRPTMTPNPTSSKSGFAVPTQAPVAGVVGVALAALMMV